MRLLFIVNSLIDLKNNVNKNGGIEHCNIELANRLSLLGHDVCLASKISKIQKKRNIVNIPINYLFENEQNNFYDVIVSSNYSQAFKFSNNFFQFGQGFLKTHLHYSFVKISHMIFLLK